ncbi:Prefoldin subunit-domain-containing protein [Ampelomyces quisqualis]|uniref:Prefoldin subunit-domain-containing protein n=1 Tax=Ampelomyces quisqualis TaxID=50730 RepID=A0A6A5QB34_AMPQU|nr:Prefoldin subunit-domain-containing protein [Ampelomyces quisqualis]
MAAATQETLESIERRRAQLQDSVEQLRKALAHWSTWESEYQVLVDEIKDVDDASPTQIREIARGLDSSLLDAKEVEELLGKDLPTKRTANQVVDIISRRIDYVQQNSATIERQLDAAEKKLAGVDLLLEPGVENEEGLPMMDIEEELDEQGNEVASSVNQTGKAAAEIVEVLRKAALQKKKTVSFAEDTKPEIVPARSALERDGYNQGLADMNFPCGSKVIELDGDDNELASYPIIPQGESPEDAELRRQMLQYGLTEVGQIVAELDLDHPTADFSEDEDEYGDETEDEEEEDQYGRSTRPVITEEYRRQMLELEKRLGARMLENVGPQGTSESLEEHVDEIRALRIRDDEQFDKSFEAVKVESAKSTANKKGVRFADALDVSDGAQPARPPPETAKTGTKHAPTTVSTTMERSGDGVEPAISSGRRAKVSRFKSTRPTTSRPLSVLATPSTAEPGVVPTGPTGRTLASTIVEHGASSSEPQAPDEFERALLTREIQSEYHKARNRMIQQQGGFEAEDEDGERPIVEERDGKTKKVSRFLAGRLKGDGV